MKERTKSFCLIAASVLSLIALLFSMRVIKSYTNHEQYIDREVQASCSRMLRRVSDFNMGYLRGEEETLLENRFEEIRASSNQFIAQYYMFLNIRPELRENFADEVNLLYSLGMYLCTVDYMQFIEEREMLDKIKITDKDSFEEILSDLGAQELDEVKEIVFK